MRKYKIARSLAWFVIVGGLAGAAFFSFFAMTQLTAPMGMLVIGRAIGVAFLGVVFALIGYGSLAVFDMAEAVTQGAGGSSNASLKHVGQSLRE